MSKKGTERAAQLAALLAFRVAAECVKANPAAAVPHIYGPVARLVLQLQAAARRAKAAETRLCNAGGSDAQYKRLSIRFAKWAGEFSCEFAALGLPIDMADDGDGAVWVKFGGDARGSCAELFIDGMPGDGWGKGYSIF